MLLKKEIEILDKIRDLVIKNPSVIYLESTRGGEPSLDRKNSLGQLINYVSGLDYADVPNLYQLSIVHNTAYMRIYLSNFAYKLKDGDVINTELGWMDNGQNITTTQNETEAVKQIKGLVDCWGCFNCKDCIRCTRCDDCSDCIDCYVCSNCERSISCSWCNDIIDCNKVGSCKNCHGCSNSKRCEDCNNCHNLHYCSNCKNCNDSHHLKNCSYCIKCSDSNDCNNCFDCSHMENCDDCKSCGDCRNCIGLTRKDRVRKDKKKAGWFSNFILIW